jgi:hypothetical protein
MTFHPYDPRPDDWPGALDHAAEGLADSVTEGLSSRASEVLADPIVQALMAADGVDRTCLEALLCRMAAKLSDREPMALRHG